MTQKWIGHWWLNFLKNWSQLGVNVMDLK